MTSTLSAPTPMEAAYVHVHGPPAAGEQACGRCGRRQCVTTPCRQAVSRKFTMFDDWVSPGGDLCQVCAWGLSGAGLRSTVMAVESGLVRDLDGVDLAALLSRPLSDQTAVVLPLRPGRKHLLPAARWGHVVVDDVAVRWGAGEVVLRAEMAWLRSRDFSVAMIHDGNPDVGLLRRIPTPEIADVLDALDRVRRWRHSPHWQIAVRASTSSSTRRR